MKAEYVPSPQRMLMPKDSKEFSYLLIALPKAPPSSIASSLGIVAGHSKQYVSFLVLLAGSSV